MRKLRAAVAALIAAAALAPVAAGAQARYSLIGAEPLPQGASMVDVQTGWPSTSFGYGFGMSPTSDVSLRFGLLYGWEGTTRGQFGLAFYAPLRFKVAQTRDFRLAFHVDPGLRLYTTSDAQFGFAFPVGLIMGFPVRPDLEVGIGIDFDMTLLVTGARSPQFVFGPQVGPYVEFHPMAELAIGLNTRFGAAIDAYAGYQGAPGGTKTDFAFVTQMVVGYRLH